MSDFNIKNKVVQANDLVQLSKWNMNTVPLKIFKALISCIDTKNTPKDNTVSISRKELNSLLDAKENDEYIKRQVKSLQKQIIELKLVNGSTMMLSLVPKVIYPSKYSGDDIQCTFAEELMPFISDLKEHFLQYDVASLKNFKSKYGLIIYEYLLSRERQERQSEHKYSISIEDLRRLTDTEKKFKAFKDLKRYVIETAVEDINSSGVEFLTQATSNGRPGVKTTHIEFTLRKRTSYTEINFDVVSHPEWIHKAI